MADRVSEVARGNTVGSPASPGQLDTCPLWIGGCLPPPLPNLPRVGGRVAFFGRSKEPDFLVSRVSVYSCKRSRGQAATRLPNIKDDLLQLVRTASHRFITTPEGLLKMPGALLSKRS
jgi:hypothetical protein